MIIIMNSSARITGVWGIPIVVSSAPWCLEMSSRHPHYFFLNSTPDELTFNKDF